jgi:hypothetical protein
MDHPTGRSPGDGKIVGWSAKQSRRCDNNQSKQQRFN